MRVRTVWVIRTARGAVVSDADGACGWARRADALEAAAVVGKAPWPLLKEAGWELHGLQLA
jgi:hypothetical protein